MPLPSPRLNECSLGLSAQSAPLPMLLNGYTANLSSPVAATCLTLLGQLQNRGQLSSAEASALCQLEDHLRETASSRTDNDEELGLDDSARSYLFSFRETSNRKPRLSLAATELVGASPPVVRWCKPDTLANRLSEEKQLMLELIKLDDFASFDIFKVARLTQQRPLQTVTMALLQRYDLVAKLSLPVAQLTSFLQEVEAAYRSNVYHNATHAADVVQSLGALLVPDGLAGQLTDLEMLSMIVAAAVHDVGHPGMRNDFLIATGADMALRYNDVSVNENMHASLAHELLYRPRNNFVEHLHEDERRFMRRLIVASILSTDMSVHSELLKDFKTSCKQYGRDLTAWPECERQIALRFFLHLADIANPCKPKELSQEWSRRITEEFFLQGDEEQRRGLPVSPLGNREEVDMPKSQLVFLDLVVRPCYECFAQLGPKAGVRALSGISAARSEWLAAMPASQAEEFEGPGPGRGRRSASSMFVLDDCN